MRFFFCVINRKETMIKHFSYEKQKNHREEFYKIEIHFTKRQLYFLATLCLAAFLFGFLDGYLTYWKCQ